MAHNGGPGHSRFAEAGGQFGDDGHFEDGSDVEFHSQGFAHAVYELHGEQRMSAQGKEVVVKAYPLELKDLSENLAEDLLLRARAGLGSPRPDLQVRGGRADRLCHWGSRAVCRGL